MVVDQKIRETERRARAGDLNAAQQWLHEASRAGDLMAQYEAMMTLFELQSPGLMKQMREIDEINKITQQVEIEPPGRWTTDIEIDPELFGLTSNTLTITGP